MEMVPPSAWELAMVLKLRSSTPIADQYQQDACENRPSGNRRL